VNTFEQFIFNLTSFFNYKKKINLSIIKNIQPPPYGGGNQFIIALAKELKKHDINVFFNKFYNFIDVFLFDSFWLTKLQLKKLLNEKKKNKKIIHRVGGLTQLYRQKENDLDIKNDENVLQLNKALADTTIFQSYFVKNEFRKYGYNLTNPTVIVNGSDSKIFYPKIKKNNNKKIQLITTSWSDNPNKGKTALDWLDKNLNFKKYSFVFVGRIKSKFKNIEIIPPQDSWSLANYLRSSDIYFAASKNEACSNSLIEALSCGLPVIYLKSGSNAELVRKAGLGFYENCEIPSILTKISENYSQYQKNIVVKKIEDIAKEYVKTL